MSKWKRILIKMYDIVHDMKKGIAILLTLTIASFGVWLLTDTENQGIPPEGVDTDTPQESPEDEEQQVVAENDSIRVFAPEKVTPIESPLTLQGEVRGTWLFEATAPVVLTDWDGRIISEGYIEAEGDWMTEEIVPFSGSLTFETPEDMGDFSDTGSLIFQKANPSGLPEHDEALEYIIRFR
jgi:hypothetical protein